MTAAIPHPTLLLPLLLLLTILHPTHSALIQQTWKITYKFISPDGVEKLVPVVNDQYPGPDLRGRVGDTVRITVINALATDTTSIHWHGIKQTGTPYSDGVPGISQCAIGPGETFVYEFALDAPGTLWWHSHSGMQKSSLYGAIIVAGDEDVVGNHEEIILLLNDWFHASSATQIAGLTSTSFRWVGDAQSLLFNGRGDFNCSATTKPCDPGALDKGPAYFDVKPLTTYRLRIIGASSLSFINFGIDAHDIEIVESETTLLKPFKTKFLDVGAGQSFSALLRTKSRKDLQALKENNGLFWMQINPRHRSRGERGLAILRYTKNSGASEPLRPAPNIPARDDVDWSLKHARRFKSRVPTALPTPSRELVLLGTQNKLKDGRLGWSINNISYTEPGTPLLHAMALEIKSEARQFVSQTTIPTEFDYTRSLSEAGISEFAQTGTHVVPLQKDEVVDFVFQNSVSLSGADEVHPWHLHLHNFWVLGFGDYQEAWDENSFKMYDTRTAVSRNTFTLYPGSWTAIRVRADNPGMAHFHCHILAHLAMGMGFVVQVGTADDLPPPPPRTQFCGTVSQLMGPPVRNPLISGGCAA